MRNKLGARFAAIALILLLAVIAFPLLWMGVTSVRPPEEIYSQTFAWPREFTLDAYRVVMETGFIRYVVNSLIVVGASTALCVLLAFPAAYCFSRLRFPGRQLLLIAVLATQLLPYITLITPLYVIFARIGLVNNLVGLILIYTALTLPFSIYVLWGYLDGVPRDLDEAASMDGCGTIGVMRRVIFPASMPGVTAIAVYSFFQMWHEFLIALTMTTREDVRTIPVGLAALFGEQSAQWEIVMAAAVVGTLPAIALFLLFQRRLVESFTAGVVR